MKIDRNEITMCVPVFDVRPGECFRFENGDKNKLFMRTDAENPKLSVIDLETGKLIETKMTDYVIPVEARAVIMS